MAELTDKEKIIKSIYENKETGYGSLKETYKQANEKDSSIKYDDVKKYVDELPHNRYHDKYYVKKIKSIINHYNYCHCGVEILSMSKRIMNEVMCLAEDFKLSIYYQDTDSMHINYEDVEILSKEFKNKYNRDLIGKDM